MALLKYSKPATKDYLPDPGGTLATLVPSHVIAQANLEVQQLLSDDKKEKVRSLQYIRTSNTGFTLELIRGHFN